MFEVEATSNCSGKFTGKDDININRKYENYKRFCCLKGLEKTFLPIDLTQNSRYETLKSTLLKNELKYVPPTSFCVKATVH